MTNKTSTRFKNRTLTQIIRAFFCLAPLLANSPNLMAKDLGLAIEAAINSDIELNFGHQTLEKYSSLVNQNEGSLDFSNIGENKLFFDVIYNPTLTNFLKEGKKLGHLSENGKLMFIYQAQESFKLWHGVGPKINNEVIKLLEND